ncbi:MAG: hypothetical protein RR375_03905 [Bacilli bacterium]
MNLYDIKNQLLEENFNCFLSTVSKYITNKSISQYTVQNIINTFRNKKLVKTITKNSYSAKTPKGNIVFLVEFLPSIEHISSINIINKDTTTLETDSINIEFVDDFITVFKKATDKEGTTKNMGIEVYQANKEIYNYSYVFDDEHNDSIDFKSIREADLYSTPDDGSYMRKLDVFENKKSKKNSIAVGYYKCSNRERPKFNDMFSPNNLKDFEVIRSSKDEYEDMRHLFDNLGVVLKNKRG